MKTYLNRAYKTELRINNKLEQLERLRALAEKTTTTLSDMPKAPVGENKGENILVRIIDMENEIKWDINHLLDTKEDVQKSAKSGREKPKNLPES